MVNTVDEIRFPTPLGQQIVRLLHTRAGEIIPERVVDTKPILYTKCDEIQQVDDGRIG